MPKEAYKQKFRDSWLNQPDLVQWMCRDQKANLVKTKLRNRLQIETLNAILSIRFGLRRKGVCCHEYEIPEKYLKMIGSNQSTKNQSLEVCNDDIDDVLNELASNKE
ncbi:uncharacterized protein LOC133835096 [Drosophila sulfurigaster albostrigata]|uniref:uncharacterized protein LOC133835096 n=1 Tax=Drosophila sulfurigaster albostrigata TaxID=89887 RepID=UPI002D219165|nr:uncharacterized protein LOC133835096 [Drosophila sulfurigaster albostrigata]